MEWNKTLLNIYIFYFIFRWSAKRKVKWLLSARNRALFCTPFETGSMGLESGEDGLFGRHKNVPLWEEKSNFIILQTQKWIYLIFDFSLSPCSLWSSLYHDFLYLFRCSTLSININEGSKKSQSHGPHQPEKNLSFAEIVKSSSSFIDHLTQYSPVMPYHPNGHLQL